MWGALPAASSDCPVAAAAVGGLCAMRGVGRGPTPHQAFPPPPHSPLNTPSLPHTIPPPMSLLTMDGTWVWVTAVAFPCSYLSRHTEAAAREPH